MFSCLLVDLQSRTKLPANFYPTMHTIQRNNTISTTTDLRYQIPLPPGQCCFLQMSKDQGCFRTHNNIAPKGIGEGGTQYSENVNKNGLGMWHFLNSFVQDCVYGVLRFPARKLWMTKRNGINKKHFTEAVLDTKFYTTWSSHRKVRALFRFFRVPSENRKILQ